MTEVEEIIDKGDMIDTEDGILHWGEPRGFNIPRVSCRRQDNYSSKGDHREVRFKSQSKLPDRRPRAASRSSRIDNHRCFNC